MAACVDVQSWLLAFGFLVNLSRPFPATMRTSPIDPNSVTSSSSVIEVGRPWM
jgi:hypothetical protein